MLGSGGKFGGMLGLLPHVCFKLTFPTEMMPRQITRAEVAEHASGDSLWIVIENNVYDLTAFLSEHPGGEMVLLEQAGKDASEAFEEVGHSAYAKELMLRYKIGSIMEHEWIEAKKKSICTLSSVIRDALKVVFVTVALGVAATNIYTIYSYHKLT